MDDDPDEVGVSVPVKHFYEVRYSLEEMMKEVSEERISTDRSRELVDKTEIGKMFKARKRKKKK